VRQFILPGSWAGEERLIIGGKQFHYLTRVLRLGPGDSFPARDSGGRPYSCLVRSVGAAELELELKPGPGEHENVPDGMPNDPRITLIMGIVKGKKMDQIIRQAAEAGAAEIIPLMSEHSVVRLTEADSGHKQERWEKIAREALQQSGTPRPPHIRRPARPEELPELTGHLDRLLYFHQEPVGQAGLHQLLKPDYRALGLIVGPEGGFSARELELFAAFHYDSVYLGKSILRAETAAVYALASVQTILRESATWQLRSPEHGA
jgi:16S rRNA (uracil1498-N3)-methyltransferase